MSSWRKKIIFLFLVTFLLGFATFPGTAMAQRKEKVTYRFTFVLVGSYAPLFLALDKGYFDEEGISIEFFEGRGTGRNIQLVGAGTEMFADADYGTVAKAIAEGVPIKAVFGHMQQSPMAVLTLAPAGIREPKDLIGRRFAAPPAGPNAMAFPALLKVNKIPVEQVKVVFADPTVLHSLLLQGKVDGLLLHWTGNVPVLEERGVKINVMKYADWGVNFLGNGMIVSSKMVQENPRLIKGVLKGVVKGYKYAEKNPEEAVEALMKRGARGSKAALLRAMLNATSLFYTANNMGKPLGWMAKKDWEDTQEIMLQYGEMKKRLPVEEFYANEFIPE